MLYLAYTFISQAAPPGNAHKLAQDTWLSIIGGGLVAALLTISFNAYWDRQKERRAEDWEFRRYRANLIHMASMGLMEVYFSAKTEIEYLVGTLGTLAVTFQQLEAQAEHLVRAQVGPGLTVVQLEQGKAALLQPFQQYNRQQVDLRWNQYEQKMKDLESRAATYVSVLAPLITADLNRRIGELYSRLTEDYEWNLPNAQQRLALFGACLPRFQEIQRDLAAQVEIQLGRRQRNE